MPSAASTGVMLVSWELYIILMKIQNTNWELENPQTEEDGSRLLGPFVQEVQSGISVHSANRLDFLIARPVRG